MAKNGGKCDGQEKWLLDLVVIGTICDSMELREENRILSYYGMKVLAKTRRPGIKELARVASVDLDQLNTHAIGFQLGPRINAAGRMKSADLALDLMMSTSRSKAFTLAGELDGLNRDRRDAQDKAVKEVSVSDDDKVIVATGKWHEGIVGIIAGRLVEIYKKPAFALTELEDGRLKGSGRSFGDFSLAEVLQKCPEGLLLSGGGHAGAPVLNHAVDHPLAAVVQVVALDLGGVLHDAVVVKEIALGDAVRVVIDPLPALQVALRHAAAVEVVVPLPVGGGAPLAGEGGGDSEGGEGSAQDKGDKTFSDHGYTS
jgi:hypothetical protein